MGETGQTGLAPAVRESAPAAGELPAIELVGVTKEFSSPGTAVVAVEDVDLQVAPGDRKSVV